MKRRFHGWMAGACCFAASVCGAADFHSAWQGNRVWIGHEYWANPLQDWRTEGGEVIASAARNRTLHRLTHQLGKEPGAFSMNVTVRLEAAQAPSQPNNVWAGFRFAVRGAIEDYRHVLIYPKEYFDAGIGADGRLRLASTSSASTGFDLSKSVGLDLRVEATGRATFIATQAGRTRTLTAQLPVAELHGNLALIAEAPRSQPQQGRLRPIHWHFRDWRAGGDKIVAHPEQTFGPILWTQYTLSRGVWKLSAQFAPLGEADPQTARLEVRRNGAWNSIATMTIHPLARTVVFWIPNWDSPRDTPYRVIYHWQDRDYTWEGIVRSDPVAKPVLVVAAFTGDNGYVFPQAHLVRNLAIQDPDLLFFSGDQIYESYGGFGAQRKAPTPVAMLDYLRKFYQFGWTWRELLKDRPSVILPDDHDVYQGNLWGQGGRKIPNADGNSIEAGGYIMPPEWVNAVQRTQTGHLPDPVDPAPCDQGISVYFTDMLYGRVSFAILEDRKFKTGPNSAFKGQVREARRGDPKKLDVPGAELLGPRQERFLKNWAQDWRDADMKVALSQTIWCEVTTHAGRELKPHGADLDSGGWPQSKRNRALDLLRRGFAFSIHGDQHSGALVHHGINDWEDGPISFMVVGTANGFPRAWWPEQPDENHRTDRARWTGRYNDALGNRMTVLAAANPEPGANKLRNINPEQLAHRKGSGHGIVRLNKEKGTATFEMWHHGFDAAHPRLGDQFEDFPQTWSMLENFDGKVTGWLPELVVAGLPNPVVQVIDEQTREVVYTLRIRGTRFRPKVFRQGVYSVRVGELGTEKERIVSHLKSAPQPSKEVVEAAF